jgi:hypothetical protein
VAGRSGVGSVRPESAEKVFLTRGGAAHRRARNRGRVLRRLLGGAWSQRHDPQLQAQALLLLGFLGAVAAFGHIVEDCLTGDPLVRWDVELSRWLHEHSDPALVSAFKVFTLLGSVPFLALLVLIVALLLLRRRQVNEAALVSFGALGIEVLFSVLSSRFTDHVLNSPSYVSIPTHFRAVTPPDRLASTRSSFISRRSTSERAASSS